MNDSTIRNVIEAALLAAGKSLQVAELTQVFEESGRPTVEQVRAALATLTDEYEGRGIEVKETAAGFRIQVRREFANEISRLWPERPAKYSRAMLETLALIAYRQPITRAEIEAVRGVAVNPNILKTMIERNWVRVVGHRDVPGRPELLGTTREFLEYFGLRNLDDLPPLSQLKTMSELNLQLELPGAPISADADGESGLASEAGSVLALESVGGDGVGADSGVGVGAGVGADVDVGSGADAGMGAGLGADAGSDAVAGSDADAGSDAVAGSGADAGLDAGVGSGAGADGDADADVGSGSDVDLEADAVSASHRNEGSATDSVEGSAPDSEVAAAVVADTSDDDSDPVRNSDSDDESGEDDELSADGQHSRELVAAPPNHDD